MNRPNIKNYVEHPVKSGCYVTHNNLSYAEDLEKYIDYLEAKFNDVDLASVVGIFSSDDIKEVYEIGRGHEKNRSDCTSEMIKKAWGKADNMYKNINWE